MRDFLNRGLRDLCNVSDAGSPEWERFNSSKRLYVTFTVIVSIFSDPSFITRQMRFRVSSLKNGGSEGWIKFLSFKTYHLEITSWSLFLKTFLLQLFLKSICTLQHVYFATCVLHNKCTLQHIHFATRILGLAKIWKISKIISVPIG